MTLNELFLETAALCADVIGQIDTGFVFTANRALLRVVTELSSNSHASFVATGIPLISLVDKYVHAPGASTEFKLTGAAFSFRASGFGKYRITKNGSSTEYSFCGKACVCRGFIPSDASITFSGDGAFVLTNLACFGSVFGDTEADIPLYSETCEYKLSDYVANIFRITAPPTDKNGLPISCARISDARLLLPAEYQGDVCIEYKRLPRKITLDDRDRELDVEPALCYLLPLLCAAYVLLDGEEERALFYMNTYENEAARLRTRFSADIGAGYQDVIGWT